MNDKNLTTIKISTQEIFYYVFFASLLFAKGIGLYDGQMWFKLFLILGCIGYVIKMCMTEFTLRELIIVGLLVLLGSIVYLVSGEKGALLYIMMITGLKNVPIKRVFVVGFITYILSFCSLFLLTSTHIMESAFKVHYKLGLGLIIRWSLGYAHPNVLHVTYLIFIMFAVYLLGKKFNIKWILFFMVGNLYVFLYSVSSTGLLAVTFYLCLNLYWIFRKNLSWIEQFLIQIAMPFFVLFSMLAPVLLKGEMFHIVNNAMNTRLSLSKHFLTTQNPTLFGVRIADLITAMFTMDNSYVFAYITYGVLLFGIIIIAYFLIIRKYCKQQKGTELSILLASLMAGVTEPFLFNASFKNISLLFVAELIFSHDKCEKNVRATEGQSRKEGIRFCIWKRGNKEIKISLLQFENIKESMHQSFRTYGKTVCILSIAMAVAVGGFYAFLVSQPERIIVPRNVCDSTNIESLYLESEDDLLQSGDKVLGYVNHKTEMIPITGNIIVVEQIRGMITSGLLAGVLTGIIAGMVLNGIGTRKKKHKDNY